MRYIGGKSRLKKHISLILKEYRNDRVYLEPFLGFGSVFSYMRNPRIGSDLDEDIILLLRALRDGWIPPNNIDNDIYNKVKNNDIKVSDELKAFIAYGCSFSGKKWGGYARGENRNYANEAHKSCVKHGKLLNGYTLLICDYSVWNPMDMLIYVDPPYKNVTSYQYLGYFDHYKFWDTMRVWGKNNMVIISEYNASDDFKSIWSLKKTTTLDHSSKKHSIENLFIFNG